MNTVLTPNVVEKEKMRIAKQAMKEDVFSEYEKLKERDRAKPMRKVGACTDWMACPVCGIVIAQDRAKFCLNCGQRIDWTEQEEYGGNDDVEKV